MKWKFPSHDPVEDFNYLLYFHIFQFAVNDLGEGGVDAVYSLFEIRYFEVKIYNIPCYISLSLFL